MQTFNKTKDGDFDKFEKVRRKRGRNEVLYNN